MFMFGKLVLSVSKSQQTKISISVNFEIQKRCTICWYKAEKCQFDTMMAFVLHIKNEVQTICLEKVLTYLRHNWYSYSTYLVSTIMLTSGAKALNVLSPHITTTMIRRSRRPILSYQKKKVLIFGAFRRVSSDYSQNR
jgi:hypothetical protein